ncbi:MAG: Holliday junction resolvase RuvX [Francisellaceae bacterium]
MDTRRLIGIDFGQARIGIASGQMITKTATPVTTIDCYEGKVDWQQMDQLIKKWRPSDIIIGLPIDTNDLETDITKAARAFANDMKSRYHNTNIHLINEAYSTREARWRLETVKQKAVSHLKVDALAACVILETWINNQQ